MGRRFTHAAEHIGSAAASDYAIIDLPVRLATVSAAWGTLSTFYPYFEDAHIDWPAILPTALAEAAAAASPRDLHAALAHLLVGLRDNHARITHAAARQPPAYCRSSSGGLATRSSSLAACPNT